MTHTYRINNEVPATTIMRRVRQAGARCVRLILGHHASDKDGKGRRPHVLVTDKPVDFFDMAPPPAHERWDHYDDER